MRERQLLARHAPGALDRLEQQLERGLVRRQVGSEAALVAERRRQPALVQQRLQVVVRLDRPAQALAERRRADRHEHELLDVDVVVGVGAAVEHVEHRHRQHVGAGAADVAPQRQVELVGGGPGDGQRHAEDGVGAEPRLGVGAVEVEQGGVDGALVERLEAAAPTSRSSPLTLPTAVGTPLPR